MAAPIFRAPMAVGSCLVQSVYVVGAAAQCIYLGVYVYQAALTLLCIRRLCRRGRRVSISEPDTKLLHSPAPLPRLFSLRPPTVPTYALWYTTACCVRELRALQSCTRFQTELVSPSLHHTLHHMGLHGLPWDLRGLPGAGGWSGAGWTKAKTCGIIVG